MTYAQMIAAPCSAGNYCVEGIDGVNKVEQTCGYGKECPAGALEGITCASGYYQDAQG